MKHNWRAGEIPAKRHMTSYAKPLYSLTLWLDVKSGKPSWIFYQPVEQMLFSICSQLLSFWPRTCDKAIALSYSLINKTTEDKTRKTVVTKWIVSHWTIDLPPVSSFMASAWYRLWVSRSTNTKPKTGQIPADEKTIIRIGWWENIL